MLLPMVTVIGYSFQNSAVLRRDPSFAGLKHYQAIFNDPVFWASLWHTLYFTCMSVIFHMTIGMIFALMLNSDRINPMLRNVLRVLYILPWLFTAVIIAVIWRLLLEPNGVVNSILLQMGIIGSKVEWFSSPATALRPSPSRISGRATRSSWSVCLAGLQGIPNFSTRPRINGAKAYQKLIFITIRS